MLAETDRIYPEWLRLIVLHEVCGVKVGVMRKDSPAIFAAASAAQKATDYLFSLQPALPPTRPDEIPAAASRTPGTTLAL